MCGACGRRVVTDRWSPLLGTARARRIAAQHVSAALAVTGHPARVAVSPTGWVVRGATGATSVVDTVSALWLAVGAARRLDEEVLTALRRAPTSDVSTAVVEAARAAQARSEPVAPSSSTGSPASSVVMATR